MNNERRAYVDGSAFYSLSISGRFSGDFLRETVVAYIQKIGAGDADYFFWLPTKSVKFFFTNGNPFDFKEKTARNVARQNIFFSPIDSFALSINDCIAETSSAVV